jgi:two-component system chemotaxis response regulator CheB
MEPENNKVQNIITIGASAGGLEAVTRLLGTLNKDLDVAIFVVIHLSPESDSDVILHILEKNTTFKCRVARDKQEIESRTLYLAPANRDLLVEKDCINVTRGAVENRYGPSIDVLFRSAAASYNACVTGIILTGLLDDGTSGMNAIKRSGGKCIVQSPEEAEFDAMPKSVLQNVEVDYNLPIAEMGKILTNIISGPICEEREVPKDVELEARIAGRITTSMEDLAELGNFTPMTCPQCGGAMVKIANENNRRYRCYTGHTFTEKFLESEQPKRIEESIWVSIRMMEERKNLLMNMNSEAGINNNPKNQRRDERIEAMQFTLIPCAQLCSQWMLMIDSLCKHI